MIAPFLLPTLRSMECSFVEKLEEEYRRHPKTLAREAWGDFIARWPWEWFCTFTFTDDTHEERAVKLFKVWRSKLNKALFGPRWHKRPPYGIYWVLATEYQKSGRVHLHGLIAGVGQTRRLDWMDHWSNLDALAGFPRILPIENLAAASRYVSKYVAKGNDLLLSDNLKDITSDLVAQAAGPHNGQASEWIAPDDRSKRL